MTAFPHVHNALCLLFATLQANQRQSLNKIRLPTYIFYLVLGKSKVYTQTFMTVFVLPQVVKHLMEK